MPGCRRTPVAVAGDTVPRTDEGRLAVTHAPDVRQRLEQARGLAEVLDACYEAFAEMLSAIRRYQDSGGPFYPALVMAAAAAADGRDALAAAPSLPPTNDRQTEPVGVANNPSDAAACLAVLSELIGSRIRGVACTGLAARDRQACEDGSQYADEVHVLITGNGP
jgi:hypothetical protein